MQRSWDEFGGAWQSHLQCQVALDLRDLAIFVAIYQGCRLAVLNLLREDIVLLSAPTTVKPIRHLGADPTVVLPPSPLSPKTEPRSGSPYLPYPASVRLKNHFFWHYAWTSVQGRDRTCTRDALHQGTPRVSYVRGKCTPARGQEVRPTR
jgi:hypothetical protein